MYAKRNRIMLGRVSSELRGPAGEVHDSAKSLRLSEPSEKLVRAVPSVPITGVEASEVPQGSSSGADACRRIARAHLSLGPGTLRLPPHLYPLPPAAAQTCLPPAPHPPLLPAPP